MGIIPYEKDLVSIVVFRQIHLALFGLGSIIYRNDSDPKIVRDYFYNQLLYGYQPRGRASGERMLL